MPRTKPTLSRLANLAARQVIKGFRAYRDEFGSVTRRAGERFARRDVAGMQDDARRRLALYDESVSRTVAGLTELLDERVEQRAVWISIKAVFSGLAADCTDWELAETFYNSVTRRIFTTVGVDDEIEFADTDFDTPPNRADEPLSRSYPHEASDALLLARMLGDTPFADRLLDLAEDARRVVAVIRTRLREAGSLGRIDRAEVIREIFYRGDGAYLIGRLFSGAARIPMVIAFRTRGERIVVDALLLDENDVSILFSFTRSSFHVECPRPYELVRFLKLLLPSKRIAELYISIGFHKHGKTELYRDVLHHPPDTFDVAPGQPGMVMIVFTMPSYDLVFKVIRDRFPMPKRVSREQVRRSYRHVFEHDRAGRLVDTQEFEHLVLDRKRFSPQLLEDLAANATRSVELRDSKVILRHVYVQRRLTPLNVYVREADHAAAAAAVLDFGRALKDLARADVFPGDLFLKNFGVTRHGRVAFYDYDELTTLTGCNFRNMPEPSSYDEAISDNPWFSVGKSDVFPEEFLRVLDLPREFLPVLLEQHRDLFEVGFWQATQERLERGETFSIIPYQAHRLVREDAGEGG